MLLTPPKDIAVYTKIIKSKLTVTVSGIYLRHGLAAPKPCVVHRAS